MAETVRRSTKQAVKNGLNRSVDVSADIVGGSLRLKTPVETASFIVGLITLFGVCTWVGFFAWGGFMGLLGVRVTASAPDSAKVGNAILPMVANTAYSTVGAAGNGFRTVAYTNGWGTATNAPQSQPQFYNSLQPQQVNYQQPDDGQMTNVSAAP